jgi:hypothetical protein
MTLRECRAASLTPRRITILTPDPEAFLAAVLAELDDDKDNVELVMLAMQLRLGLFQRQMAALERRQHELDAARRCN